jgi:iron complex outermembrane recepter protein
MPSLDARYKLKPNWTVYAQFATGSVIPPTNVFDTKGALVAVLPKPTTTKTYQLGSVLKFNRVTLDVDGYYSHFQNPYSSAPDASGEPVYYQTGPSNTKGVEAESNILIGHGFSLYLNGTLGSAKYQNTGLWVQNAPKNTETVGFTYQLRGWDLGFFNKRIGTMYNDNGAINQAVAIDPFNVTNLFLNYTIRGDSYLRGTKVRLGINNLLDKHSIVGVTPALANSAVSPNDILTMLPARSVSLTVTFGYAPVK